MWNVYFRSTHLKNNEMFSMRVKAINFDALSYVSGCWRLLQKGAKHLLARTETNWGKDWHKGRKWRASIRACRVPHYEMRFNTFKWLCTKKTVGTNWREKAAELNVKPSWHKDFNVLISSIGPQFCRSNFSWSFYQLDILRNSPSIFISYWKQKLVIVADRNKGHLIENVEINSIV